MPIFTLPSPALVSTGAASAAAFWTVVAVVFARAAVLRGDAPEASVVPPIASTATASMVAIVFFIV